jgi:GAF domain-containing protein
VRVLALTRNASLLVALGSMMREWEVVSVKDVASAVQDASTKPASQPRSMPAAEEHPAKPSARTESSVGSTAAAQKPQTESQPEPEKRSAKSRPLSVVPPAETRPPVQKPLTAQERREAELQEAKRAEAERREAQRVEAERKEAERREAKRLEAEQKDAERREEKRRELERREAEHREAAKLDAERRKAERLEAEHAAAEQRGASGADPEVIELPPAVVTTPEPAREAQSPRPQTQTVAASAATAPAEFEAEPARRRLRRRGSRPQDASPEELESPLVRRLKQAAMYTVDLEALIEELPFLADLSSMADGLVSEVESQFSAQVASVFVRRTDGYHVVAHRGLSRVEAGMVVPETQPLISDVLQTGEGILIQPVDLAQGLVAGIGGARTEALMAVPAVVHGACVAIVVVGHDRFTELDLDRLSDLAGEAAPGLAVALALARLRERI